MMLAQELEPPQKLGNNGVVGFQHWEQIYSAMDNDREWVDFKPEGGWQREGLLERFLKEDMHGVEEIVFSIRRTGSDWHWYANFGYTANNANHFLHGDGSQLVVLNLRTGNKRVLLEDMQGTIRDPSVHYDGKTILFSYRKGGTKQFDLYTIQSDGSQLKQITSGEFDDIEPAWMPDGDIVFCSSRARRWVPCYASQVAIIYRCSADGTNIRPISCNVETDNTPWMMPDGRILYTRWEYVDRNQDLSYHHLWTFNPDGTGAMTYVGNQFAGILMIGGKPVPNSDKVVASVAPGHGRNEGTGAVALIGASKGPDDLSASRVISRPEPIDKDDRYGWVTGEQRWRDPYAFSENSFLVARNRSIYVMDGEGYYEPIYTLSDEWEWPNPGERSVFMAHEPRPLVARKKEPILSNRTDMKDATGTFILADVTTGRNMDGVETAEDAHDLLILEVLPKPINHFGGADIIATYPTYFLYRVLGTVPVAEDGSAYFEVPALRPVFFVLRNKEGKGIKRMRSFTSVMPGEVMSCIGCHENRTQTPHVDKKMTLDALRNPPAPIEPIADMPEVFDFPRDVQPLFDQYCVSCHSDTKYAGRLSFTGARNNAYSQAYTNLFRRGILEGNKPLVQIRSTIGNHPAYSDGSYASAIVDYFNGTHKKVQATDDELQKLKVWIDAGAPYAGTYGALASGMVSYRTPPVDVLERNCVSCHGNKNGETNWRKTFPEHAFNLRDPNLSLMLLAPLDTKAGGLGWCKKDGETATVFKSRDDPDYRLLQANLVEHARWSQEDVKGYGLPDFRPSSSYIREMKRFGIIPADFDVESNTTKPYQWDQQYWKLFHYHPEE